jgi:DNA mismatch endonuclease, patch repair protein
MPRDFLSPKKRNRMMPGETRSRIMAAIRSKDTRPELLLRKGLFALGLRYRTHGRGLPGTPDLVFAKHRAVLFVHGCFWHGHMDCRRFKPPRSRKVFWRTKVSRNQDRDSLAVLQLLAQGWRVAEVWECAVAGTDALVPDKLYARLVRWVLGKQAFLEVRGKPFVRE